MKYFRMSYKEVVFERSYINLILLNRAIPGMKPFDEDKELEEDSPFGNGEKVIRRAPREQHASSFFMQFM